ncbi:MAG TPA: hypothetical protein VMS21_07135 [Methylomirabilota bacterium]|nr:hypothetical protein [Methylomirabilota bacterium]
MKLKSVLNTTIARGTLATGFLVATLVAVAQQPPQQPPQQPRQQQPPDQQQLIERMQQTRVELDQVMSRLTEVQEKANKEKDVKKVLEPLEEAIYGTMKQKAPDLEEQVDRLEELTSEIRESGELNQEEPQSEEFTKNIEEYQQLKRQLGPVEQQALQDPGVSEKLQTYQSQLIETMNKIEPKTKDLLNRQGELVAQLQAIQQSVQQNQQPRPLPQESPEG